MVRFHALRMLALLVLSVPSAGRADAAPLATVAEAGRLADEDCLTPRPFDFTGTVLSTGKRFWFFRDATGGIEVHNQRPQTVCATPGDTVRISGSMTFTENGVRRFLVAKTTFVRHGRLEAPLEASASDILDGSMNGRPVRIRGVISSVVPDEVDTAFTWAVLRTPNGNVHLSFDDATSRAYDLHALIDAEVAVTGLAVPMTGLRRNLGNRIMIERPDSLAVVRRPPADPFTAPDLSEDRMFPHRQKVRGVVLASEPHRFFLKTPVGRVITVCPAAAERPHAPLSGDLVTAVGFTDGDPYRTRLSDALLRRDGRADLPGDTQRQDLKFLFVDEKGLKRFDSDIDGTFISIRGLVHAVSPDELRIAEGPYAVSLDVATLNMHGIPAPADGCRVAVSGLCLAEFESPPTPSIYPTFRRFVLVPRNASDLTILSSPPWWTPFRLTVLLAVLASVLAGSALWNVLLNRKSEKRGRELYEERIDHALARQKVEERTRLAVELHDSLSQTLTGVALQLDGGRTETARTMLASCRGELRRCLWDLRSRTFEEKDMTEAIRRTLTPHLNGRDVTVRFNVPRERLSDPLAHAILRIIRELVVNALRHGRAGHVRVAGEMHGSTASFSVTDDGIGFDPRRVPGPEQGHFGLLGVRERIENLGGEIEIESAANCGAKITVKLPTSEKTNERQDQDPHRR